MLTEKREREKKTNEKKCTHDILSALAELDRERKRDQKNE